MYFRSRALILHLKLALKKKKTKASGEKCSKPADFDEARGRKRYRKCNREEGVLFFFFGGYGVSIKSLLYHTLKELAHFM